MSRRASATALPVAAALFLALGATSIRAAAPADPALVLLRASLGAPKVVSYVGQLETVRFSSSRATATIVRVEHRAPSLTRRWYLAPESLYGDYTITRGIATYDFDIKNSRVTISHNPALDEQISSAGNFDRVLANYRAVLGGNDIIAGRATRSVVLINKYTGERAIRVWIDERTHLVLKKEEYHGNGAVASQMRFEGVRYTNAIPDGVFSTDPPSGYAQIAGHDFKMPSTDVGRVIQEAGFAPASPKDLPQGFSLVGGSVATTNGVKTIHLVYSDGLRTISLFENATGAAADFGALRPKTLRFENHDAEYVEDGPTTLLTWREHGLYFALVGDLLRNELVDIAKSVVP